MIIHRCTENNISSLAITSQILQTMRGNHLVSIGKQVILTVFYSFEFCDFKCNLFVPNLEFVELKLHSKSIETVYELQYAWILINFPCSLHHFSSLCYWLLIAVGCSTIIFINIDSNGTIAKQFSESNTSELLCWAKPKYNWTHCQLSHTLHYSACRFALGSLFWRILNSFLSLYFCIWNIIDQMPYAVHRSPYTNTYIRSPCIMHIMHI